jgi:hypothetical protein
MDAAAFWQENKRWVGGVALGLLVWFVASKIVGSLANPEDKRRQAQRAVSAEGNLELYDAAAQAAARADNQELRSELTRLEAELAFEPDAKYDPAGKGMTADDYLNTVGSALKRSLVQRCNRLGVELSDKKLVWPTTGVFDEIRSVLVGVNLIDLAANRLLDAHEQVRKNDPEAIGLRSIESFRMEPNRARNALGKSSKPGEPDVSGRLAQEKILFEFQSDTATALLFFEALRVPRKTLVVETMTVTGGRAAGEPVTVKGALLGVMFRKEGP